MIDYKLAKQLKGAGFSQDKKVGEWFANHNEECPAKNNSSKIEDCMCEEGHEIYIPTIPELIEACLKEKPDYWFEVERNSITKKWLVRLADMPAHGKLAKDIFLEIGDSFEEALSKLWLALNKK